MAPIALIGIAGVGVLGRIGGSVERPAPSVALLASAAPAAAAVPTPSHRSDWPAAISRPGATSPPLPVRPGREEGTDGLMGGRPFHIPGDTPYHPPVLVNRFTIDDVALGWSIGPGMATHVRRVGGLPSYVVDPRER